MTAQLTESINQLTDGSDLQGLGHLSPLPTCTGTLLQAYCHVIFKILTACSILHSRLTHGQTDAVQQTESSKCRGPTTDA